MSKVEVLLLAVALAACKGHDEPQKPPAPAPAPAAPVAPVAIDGFADAAAERAVERTFLAVPSADDVKAQLTELAAKPHMAGTQGDADVATLLAGKLKLLGFDVSVEERPSKAARMTSWIRTRSSRSNRRSRTSASARTGPRSFTTKACHR
jgi:hypothetical protein